METNQKCRTCGKKARVKIIYDWHKPEGTKEYKTYKCFEHYISFENAHRDTNEFVVVHSEIL